MRLIDADALRSATCNSVVASAYMAGVARAEEVWHMFAKAIDEAPTVDVVRCADCEHYNTTGCSVGFGWCESMDRGASDEFFCSCGAKMEGESERYSESA